jgi:hypothetical protein
MDLCLLHPEAPMVQRRPRRCLYLVNQDRVEADISFDDASAGRSHAGLLNMLDLILVSSQRHISTSELANWERCTVLTIRAMCPEYYIPVAGYGLHPGLLFPRRLYKISLLDGSQAVSILSASYQSNILSNLERRFYDISSDQ